MNVIMVLLFPFLGNAFFDPNLLRCKSLSKTRVTHSSKNNTYPSGERQWRISEVAILTVFDGRSEVAKLYPQNGIESVVLSAKYKVETDKRSYWRVKSGAKPVIDCEIIND